MLTKVKLINIQHLLAYMKQWLFLLILLFAASSHAQLYADVIFEVRDTGAVDISGETNYDAFQGTTNALTSKEGALWFLNITSPAFEEFIYTIRLPQHAIINYIKSNSQVRIEEQAGSITITSTGQKRSIDVKIQYSIDVEARTLSFLWVLVTIIVLGGIAYAAYIITAKKKAEKIPKKVLNRSLFTERQLMILDYLQKHGTVTQAQLEKDLKLPKSSLSRNIDTLVQKEVIFKETKGMSNVIGFRQ